MAAGVSRDTYAQIKSNVDAATAQLTSLGQQIVAVATQRDEWQAVLDGLSIRVDPVLPPEQIAANLVDAGSAATQAAVAAVEAANLAVRTQGDPAPVAPAPAPAPADPAPAPADPAPAPAPTPTA